VDREQLIKAFTATVQASLHGLRELHGVLQQEQQAILGKDPERLEQLARQKLELIKQIDYSVQARDRLQKTAGAPAGHEGGEAVVEAIGLDTLTQEWAELTRAGREVAAHNDRNGQLVMHEQHNTRAALEILTGRHDDDSTYSTLRRRGRAVASYSLGKV
jgi:flagellar biosynthesis/type III secretory pathway chaperone